MGDSRDYDETVSKWNPPKTTPTNRRSGESEMTAEINDLRERLGYYFSNNRRRELEDAVKLAISVIQPIIDERDALRASLARLDAHIPEIRDDEWNNAIAKAAERLEGDSEGMAYARYIRALKRAPANRTTLK